MLCDVKTATDMACAPTARARDGRKGKSRMASAIKFRVVHAVAPGRATPAMELASSRLTATSGTCNGSNRHTTKKDRRLEAAAGDALEQWLAATFGEARYAALCRVVEGV